MIKKTKTKKGGYNKKKKKNRKAERKKRSRYKRKGEWTRGEIWVECKMRKELSWYKGNDETFYESA